MAKGIGYLHALGIGLTSGVTFGAGGAAESLRGPFLINDDHQDGWMIWSPMRGPSPGAFPYGDALYFACIDYGNYFPPKMLKSTDDGATWSDVSGFTFPGEEPEQWGYWPVRIGDTSHIRIIQFGSGRVLNMYDFDMATDALTLESTSSALSGWEWIYWLHYNHVTGEDLIFYRHSEGGDTNTWLWRYKDGTWEAPQKIYDQPALPISMNWSVSPVTDDAGVTHVLAFEYTYVYPAPTVYKVMYFQIAADGTIGAIETVWDLSNPPAEGFMDFHQTPRPSIINDTIVWPIYGGVFLLGTGLGAPVFSIEDLFPDSEPQGECAVNANNAYHFPGTDGRLWYITETQINTRTFDGTTAGPLETIHDETTNPSFPGNGYQYLMMPSPPVQLAANRWGFHIGMYDQDQYYTNFYWEWTKGTAGAKGVARIS